MLPQYTPDFLARFWSYVDKTDGCWLWTGPTISSYGYLKYQGAKWRANHVSWQLHYGPIPPGARIRITCQRKSCVRPDHLACAPKGTPMPESQRAHLSAKIKGRTMPPRSQQWRERLSAALKGQWTGPLNPRWKGGHEDGRFTRWHDPLYLQWRQAVLEKDGYTCQGCGAKAGKNMRWFHAHHIKPYLQYPELRYMPENGTLLCFNCHIEAHGGRVTNRRAVGLKGVPNGEKHWTRRMPERTASGERNGQAKLTWEIVRQIRRLYDPSARHMPGHPGNQRNIARQFDISPATVQHIVSGKAWKEEGPTER